MPNGYRDYAAVERPDMPNGYREYAAVERPDCILTCSSNPPAMPNEIYDPKKPDPDLFMAAGAYDKYNSNMTATTGTITSASSCFNFIPPNEAHCRRGGAPVAWFRRGPSASFQGFRIKQSLALPVSVWVLIVILGLLLVVCFIVIIIMYTK